MARFREIPCKFPCSQGIWLLETGFARLHPPPPSPAEPGVFLSGSNRPFVPGFPLSVLRRFSLCGSSLSLSAISGARSPHPKIPFLADKALAGGCGFVERSHSRRIHDGRFAGVRYCCGVKPSASNWRDHSAGASRSRAMLTPRGRRPSTAARTSLGARKASEIVMLT